MDSTTTKEAITGYNISSHTIKYGTTSDCTKTSATSPGTPKIDTPKDTGPTLTITGITADALRDTNGTVDATVKVDTEKKTLTINYDGDKCIEITLTSANTIKKEATPVHYGHIFTGMIVPFYLIDKIEMVLLIATAIPAITIAILRATDPDNTKKQSPACNWDEAPGWHTFDLLIPLKITLAYIFIYSLHYRE